MQSASQSLSAPHRRVRGHKPVAIAIENTGVLFDGLVGDMPLGSFLCLPDVWSNDTAQGECHHPAKDDVHGIQVSLPLT
jgi:hypothetical protein